MRQAGQEQVGGAWGDATPPRRRRRRAVGWVKPTRPRSPSGPALCELAQKEPGCAWVSPNLQGADHGREFVWIAPQMDGLEPGGVARDQGDGGPREADRLG